MAGSEKRKRRHQISVRFEPREYAELIHRADKAGLSVAGYFRSAVLQTPPPRQSRRPPVDKIELAKVLGALGKIGSNVNQLARVANAGSWPEAGAIYEAQADIRTMRLTLMEALGIHEKPQAQRQP